MEDPLAEARAKWARATLKRETHQVNTPIDVDVLPSTFTHDGFAERRNTLLATLHSVEEWLRTGQYRGLQLSLYNDEHEDVKAAREMLQRAADDGVAASVREMLGTGETSEEVQQVAEYMQQQVRTALKLDDAGIPVAINMSALGRASMTLSTAICDGPSVHLRFDSRLGVFLCCESAECLCADCSAPVHVLQASLLGCSKCERCGRARCLRCSEAGEEQARAGCSQCRNRPKKR